MSSYAELHRKGKLLLDNHHWEVTATLGALLERVEALEQMSLTVHDPETCPHAIGKPRHCECNTVAVVRGYAENAVTVEVLDSRPIQVRFTLSGGKTWTRWIQQGDKQVISLSLRSECLL